MATRPPRKRTRKPEDTPIYDQTIAETLIDPFARAPLPGPKDRRARS